MKFGFNRPVVSEEKMFENVDIHTYIHTHTHTYIHTHIYIHAYMRPSYSISSPMNLKAQES